eukprot:scaffold14585_cov71-Cylindrotheca_fusiformis.AAC.1
MNSHRHQKQGHQRDGKMSKRAQIIKTMKHEERRQLVVARQKIPLRILRTMSLVMATTLRRARTQRSKVKRKRTSVGLKSV